MNVKLVSKGRSVCYMTEIPVLDGIKARGRLWEHGDRISVQFLGYFGNAAFGKYAISASSFEELEAYGRALIEIARTLKEAYEKFGAPKEYLWYAGYSSRQRVEEPLREEVATQYVGGGR